MLLERLRGNEVSWRTIYSQLFGPIDSVRYFEFGFLWDFLSPKLGGSLNYLDISSPRLFPLEVISQSEQISAVVINPDGSDVAITRECLRVMTLAEQVQVFQTRIEDLDLPKETFDLITAISVLEHIPEEKGAILKAWSLLKPGGEFFISVPCSPDAFEEWLDFDEYQLYPPDEEGFVFAQRFFDERTLRERFFNLIGDPVFVKVVGERRAGFFFEDRNRKIGLGHEYPFWSEPIRTLTNWRVFSEIDSMPGVGIVLMIFRKVETE
jgi:SAM-dependent methyltransferase